MPNVYVSSDSLQAAADAIRTKNGTQDTYRPGDFADAILALPGPDPEEPPRKDVNFYRYDGRRMYSYTLEEVQTLTALPDLPTLDGFSFEWNWTLAGLKAHAGKANVGAWGYRIGDESLFEIETDGSSMVSVIVSTTVSEFHTVKVSWSDGFSESGAIRFRQNFTSYHQPASGTHILTVSCDCACAINFDDNITVRRGFYAQNHGAYRLGHASRILWYIGGRTTGAENVGGGGLEFYITPPGETTIKSIRGCSALKRICFGEGCKLQTARTQWADVRALKEIYVSAQTSAPVVWYNNAALGLRSLEDFWIPTATYPSNFMREVYGLGHLIIPEGVTSIADGSFYDADGLESVEFPASLTTLSGFATGRGLRVIKFKSATPPSVSSSGVFPAFGILYGSKILVPQDSLSLYMTATNLSRLAAYMEGY